MMEQRRQHRVRIHGRVQGVGYRDALVEQARALGVAGWVRNRADGSVEAVIQGEAAALAQLVQWCHRGPPLARVDDVDVCTANEPVVDGFERRPTA